MAPYPATAFISDQLKTLPEAPTVDLTGRTVIVTGGNAGLGYECAKKLAFMNPAKLIIACRSISKGQEAAGSIKEAADGNCQPEVWQLDLADMKQTLSFGQKCLDELDRLDIFLSNAGISPMGKNEKDMAESGYELTLQVNNISNTLLCHQLLPLMQKTAQLPPPSASLTNFKPHLTIVASDRHYSISQIPQTEPILRTMSDISLPGNRYEETKAINLLNAIPLAELAGESVIVNTCSPGWCYSGLIRNLQFPLKYIHRIPMAILARTGEQGSRCIIWATISDVPNGSYCDTMEVREPSDYVISEEGKTTASKLYKEMKDIWKTAGYIATD
ncbi:uncharacterized protein L201_005148 [Kwoniella dendrophila CBS 6074]|uniref:NAD(P)-binding protein n=1 Tax=Kwoniella dendrophila CBS 6074 TaxID=1295534 RepID=A0AAX4K0B3_9TREE